MRNLLLQISLLFIGLSAMGQQTSKVTFYTDLMMASMIEANSDISNLDEWLDFEITRFDNNQVLYTSSISLSAYETHEQEFCFQPGTYRLNIIDMGANIFNPTITLNTGEVVPWGYPEYEYYLIEIEQDMLTNDACSGTLISMNPPVTTEPDTSDTEPIDTIFTKPTIETFSFKTFANENQLNLEFELAQEETIEVVATTYTGQQQVLLPKQLEGEGRHTRIVDITSLKSGIYFITVLHNGVKNTQTIRVY